MEEDQYLKLKHYWLTANTREGGNTNKNAIQLYSTQYWGEWNKKLHFKGIWASPTHKQSAAYPDSLVITRTTSTGRPHRTSVMTIVIKTYHICIRAFVVMYNLSCQAVPLAAVWDVSTMCVFNYISLRIWPNNKGQLLFLASSIELCCRLLQNKQRSGWIALLGSFEGVFVKACFWWPHRTGKAHHESSQESRCYPCSVFCIHHLWTCTSCISITWMT